MKSFIQFNEEAMIATLTKDLLPKKILHVLKRILHKDKYKQALQIQKDIMKRGTMSASFALVKAAEQVGLKPRELAKVMDKETRHK